MAFRPCFAVCSALERGVHIVDVLLVKLLPQKLHCFAEALEMHDLAFAQELDRIVHIRVVRQTQNVVIRCPGFLFCCNCINTTFCNKMCR